MSMRWREAAPSQRRGPASGETKRAGLNKKVSHEIRMVPPFHYFYNARRFHAGHARRWPPVPRSIAQTEALGYVQCVASVRGDSSCTGESCTGPGTGLIGVAERSRGRSSGQGKTITATAGIAKSAAAGRKSARPADDARARSAADCPNSSKPNSSKSASGKPNSRGPTSGKSASSSSASNKPA